MTGIQEQVPLTDFTRLGIGGPADFFTRVRTPAELEEAIAWADGRGVAWIVIGEGTNLLVADAGFRGLVIRVEFAGVEFDQGPANGSPIAATVTAGAGENLMGLIEQAAARGLSGLERMYGIPGTVGAGVYGNVGAYGTEIKDTLTGVQVLRDGKIVTMTNADCGFEYRSSVFKGHKDWLVLSATFALRQTNPDTIRRDMDEILAKRLAKYPDGLKCPGSYFKNIRVEELDAAQSRAVEPFMDRVIAGKLAAGILLEAAGAKGMSVGGAAVADYHGNLIFNSGSATAADVRALGDSLKEAVQARFGIRLQEEVQFLGDF